MNLPASPDEPSAIPAAEAPAPAPAPAAEAPPAAPVAPRPEGHPLPASAANTRFQDVVCGQFDAEGEDPEDPAAPARRVLTPHVETPKLHKILAQAGLGSRLEMEQLINEGRISVNGEPAHTGQRIQFGDQIKVNGKPIRVRIDPPAVRVIAYHKPVGEVVTQNDPQNRPTVFRKLPRLPQGKWQSVGRLDLNTEGLLLFTNSGELANRLMHPRFGLEREYAVRVLGALSTEERNKLLSGVSLDDGVAQFGSIEEGGGEGANCWYRVTISEGRHREVRRMIESVGHAVSRLIRIRYGAMVLPRGLRRGTWLELDDADIQALTRASGPTPLGRAADSCSAWEANGNGVPPRGARVRNRRGPGARLSNLGPKPPMAPRGRPNNISGVEPPRAPARSAPPDFDEFEDRITGPQPDPLRTSVQSLRRGAGGGRRGGGAGGLPPGRGGSSQPDPMKTAFGYIGADSFIRQRSAGRSGPSNGFFQPGGNAGPRRNSRGKR